jgi:hypothetical protein
MFCAVRPLLGVHELHRVRVVEHQPRPLSPAGGQRPVDAGERQVDEEVDEAEAVREVLDRRPIQVRLGGVEVRDDERARVDERADALQVRNVVRVTLQDRRRRQHDALSAHRGDAALQGVGADVEKSEKT